MATDLYQILGVTKGTPAKEIKKAYRALAQKLHPDRNPNDPAAEERFKEVSAAFAVLGDEKKRKLYDEFGADGLREGFDPEAARNYQRWAGQQAQGGFPGGGSGGFGGFGGFGDMDDILSSLFGGGRGRGRPRPTRGANLASETTISLRQAIEGTELEMPGGGRIRVPAGIGDGQKIRARGKGAEGPAGRGDLVVEIHVATPPGFVRDGDDLTLDVPLTVRQAVAGDKVEVLIPNGKTINLTVPAGSQSGRRMRIRGKGMTRKGGRGDLYVRLLVRVPTGDSPELLAAVEALEAFY